MCWYDMLTVLHVYILYGICGILVIPFMFALVINDQRTHDDERE